MIENSLIAYDTSKNIIMDIAKHCLTATGCPSGPEAHKIGQQVFPGLPVCLWPSQLAATCSKQGEAVWRLKNKARLVAQATLSCQAASYY